MAGKERNENSVLISIDELSAGSPKQAGQGSGPNRDESGLIDLQGLTNSGLVGRAGGDVDSPSSAPAFEPSSTLRVPPSRQGPGVGLIVGVALGTILVLGGGVMLGIKFMAGDNDAAATAAAAAAAGALAASSGAASAAVAPPSGPGSLAAAPGSTAESAANAPGSAPESVAAAAGSTPGSEAEDDDEDEAKGTGKTPAKPSKRSGTRTAKRNTPAAPAVPATSSSRAMVAAAVEAPKRNSEVDDMLGALEGRGKTGQAGDKPAELPPDPTLPPSLSRQQIMSVVTRNAAGVRKCTQEMGGGSGTATVEMVINASGNVTEADVVGGELKGTPLGDCVSRKVKVFRFAQFNGDPMRIKMPFRL